MSSEYSKGYQRGINARHALAQAVALKASGKMDNFNVKDTAELYFNWLESKSGDSTRRRRDDDE